MLLSIERMELEISRSVVLVPHDTLTPIATGGHVDIPILIMVGGRERMGELDFCVDIVELPGRIFKPQDAEAVPS